MQKLCISSPSKQDTNNICTTFTAGMNERKHLDTNATQVQQLENTLQSKCDFIVFIFNFLNQVYIKYPTDLSCFVHQQQVQGQVR